MPASQAVKAPDSALSNTASAPRFRQCWRTPGDTYPLKTATWPVAEVRRACCSTPMPEPCARTRSMIATSQPPNVLFQPEPRLGFGRFDSHDLQAADEGEQLRHQDMDALQVFHQEHAQRH
jgi:hypothetical protein